MQRAFEPPSSRDPFRTRFAAVASPPGQSSVRRLPPTRTARPARSRGVFFGGRRRSRIGHWILNAVCIALATLAITASAHFAQPAFNAAANNGNAGPELLASATRTPSFCSPPQLGPGSVRAGASTRTQGGCYWRLVRTPRGGSGSKLLRNGLISIPHGT